MVRVLDRTPRRSLLLLRRRTFIGIRHGRRLGNGSGTWGHAGDGEVEQLQRGHEQSLLTWFSGDNAFFQTTGTLTAAINTGATVRVTSLTQAVAGTSLTVAGGTLQIDSDAGIVDAPGTTHSIIVNSALALNSPNVKSITKRPSAACNY